MTPSDIRGAVRQFLDLVDRGAGSAEANEARLSILLDRLALAVHYAGDAFDDADHPDPPAADIDAPRAAIRRLFPDLGYYNVAEHVIERIGESGCTVGDAIDDLVDITRELRDVEWRWSSTSEADALWHLRHGYETHWRAHLRELQGYLNARARSER